MFKVKRNDVIVIETRQVSTDINTGKRNEYTYYTLARAGKVTRSGVVETYVRKFSGLTYTLSVNERVICITDAAKQAAARELFAIIKDDWFGTADRLRAAITEREEALA